MKEFGLKTILFPIDFSEASNNALPLAVYVAIKSNARLILIHIVKLSVNIKEQDTASFSPEMNGTMKLSTEVLSQTAAHVSKADNIEVDYAVLKGAYCEQVPEAINAYKADILIMGFGDKDLPSSIFETDVFRIINSSNVPLLTLHEKVKFRQVSEVIFPVNEDIFTLQKADEVSYLAKIFGAKISLLGIMSDFYSVSKMEENLLIAISFLTKRKQKFDSKLIKGENYSTEILKLCNNNMPNLVTIAGRHVHGITSVFHNKQDKKVIAYATSPVLTVPIKE